MKGATPVVPFSQRHPRLDDGDQAPGSCWNKRTGMAILGVLYVGATLYGSTQFLASATAFLSNDVFWPAFNASVGAVFVASASNGVLKGQVRTATMSLTDARFAIASDTPLATMSMTTTRHYPRLLQYNRLTSIEDGVMGLRSVPGHRALYIVSQYCWVDFDRRWSLAHTERRAERCLQNHADNAAVYLESVLRNVQWDRFISSVDTRFQNAIAKELARTDDGLAFLASVKMNGSNSIADEATQWRSKGLTHFTLRYHNLWQLGLDESVYFATALGLRSAFRVKDIPFENRWTQQTTKKMYWTATNDFWAVDPGGNTRMAGCSLIRNASNFYERRNITLEEVMINDGQLPYPFTPTDELFRAAVGPFGSIDMIWIAPPQSLLQLVDYVQQAVNAAALMNETARSVFYDISRTKNFAFVPRRWTNTSWRFVGGSPLCSSPFNVTYPIQQFMFEDMCWNPTQEVVKVNAFYFVFAALTAGIDLSGNLTSLCQDVAKDLSFCASSLGRARTFVDNYVDAQQRQAIASLASITREDVGKLNVSMMQIMDKPQRAGRRRFVLEVEPLVSTDLLSGTNIFAMLFLLDWSTGVREVVSFEGDHGSLTLLSANTKMLTVSTTNLSNSVAPYLLVAVWMVTLVLIFVALLVLLYSLRARFHISGKNLIAFNRVSGIAWIGRPLLVLRGVVAMCMLSSSTPIFVTDGYFTWMEETSTHWFIKFLTAGETTWLLCVAIDLFLVSTHGLAYAFAPLSHTVSWILVALFQHLYPMVHEAVFDQRCHFVQLEQIISCSSGTITIGSSIRFRDIVGICAGTLVVSFVIVRMRCQRHLRRDDTTLLPTIAHEVYDRDGWIHDEDWFVDPASAAMAGLVTWKWRGKIKVLDVKSWAAFCCETGRGLRDTTPAAFKHAIRLRRLKMD